MTAPTMADVFRRAAEVLRERGHCKGALRDVDGRVCFYEALCVAATRESAVSALTFAAHELHGFDPAALPIDPISWNDAPERTPAEVEKFALHCADRAEFEATS